MQTTDIEKLQRMASLSKDFLEAADFPQPYYPDSLGNKVVRMATAEEMTKLDTLRRELIGARISKSLEQLCLAQIKLAEAFLITASNHDQGRSFSLIARANCTPEMADDLRQVKATTLAGYVSRKSASPLF